MGGESESDPDPDPDPDTNPESDSDTEETEEIEEIAQPVPVQRGTAGSLVPAAARGRGRSLGMAPVAAGDPPRAAGLEEVAARVQAHLGNYSSNASGWDARLAALTAELPPARVGRSRSRYRVDRSGGASETAFLRGVREYHDALAQQLLDGLAGSPVAADVERLRREAPDRWREFVRPKVTPTETQLKAIGETLKLHPYTSTMTNYLYRVCSGEVEYTGPYRGNATVPVVMLQRLRMDVGMLVFGRSFVDSLNIYKELLSIERGKKTVSNGTTVRRTV